MSMSSSGDGLSRMLLSEDTKEKKENHSRLFEFFAPSERTASEQKVIDSGFFDCLRQGAFKHAIYYFTRFSPNLLTKDAQGKNVFDYIFDGYDIPTKEQKDLTKDFSGILPQDRLMLLRTILPHYYMDDLFKETRIMPKQRRNKDFDPTLFLTKEQMAKYCSLAVKYPQTLETGGQNIEKIVQFINESKQENKVVQIEKIVRNKQRYHLSKCELWFHRVSRRIMRLPIRFSRTR